MTWPPTGSAPATPSRRPTARRPGSASSSTTPSATITSRNALANLRTPRHLFKFLHRLIEEHCHRHTEDAPRWTIDYDTFRTTYAAYMRDLEAFDRGYGHG